MRATATAVVVLCLGVEVTSFQHSSGLPGAQGGTSSAAVARSSRSSSLCHRSIAQQQQQRYRRVTPLRMAGGAETKEVAVDTKKSTAAASANGKTQTDAQDFPVLNLDPEDTGIKVTPNAWKWPVTWPYVGDYFDRDDVEPDAQFYAEPNLSKVLDDDAEAALETHFARFIGQGSKVLELGTGAHSYLPEGLNLAEHSGIGINSAELAANTALTTPGVVQDLNTNVKLQYEDESFDTVLINNAMEFFLDPRGLLREVNRVLKVDGRCIVSFTGKDAYKDYTKKQIKMWRDMNDAQHMWIIGSFFQFSAGESWSDLKGYDLTPAASTGLMANLSGGKSVVYTVTAVKSPPPAQGDVMGRIRAELRKANDMDNDEFELCALRLFADHRNAATPEEAEAVIAAAAKVPDVYSVLSQLRRGILFPPFKALLASRLVTDGWTGSELQVDALKGGLGLVTREDDPLWVPMGKLTMQLEAEDKVLLLAGLVPKFGDPSCESQLNEFVPTLTAAMDVIKEKLPKQPTGEVQLLATDLMLTDYIGAADKGAGFIDWLKSTEADQLTQWLEDRKTYKEVAAKAKAASTGAESEVADAEVAE